MNFSFETAFHQWTVEAYAILAGGAVIALTAASLYCLSIQQLLRAVAPTARRIRPWQVWLLALPFFNVLFILWGANRLVHSLRAEATSRSLNADVRPIYTAGIAMATAGGLCYVPHLHLFGILAFVVCWILHWVQVAEWCGKLRCENRVSACERVLYEHRPFNA